MMQLVSSRVIIGLRLQGTRNGGDPRPLETASRVHGSPGDRFVVAGLRILPLT